MQELEKLKPVTLQLQIEKDKLGKKYAIIKNNNNETAFFIRLKVRDKQTNELVLPVFFEDNYITLFHGEQKKIEIDLSHLKPEISSGNLQLETEAWNSLVIKKDLE